MEHRALYRKWRPQNFHTVVGQEDTVKVLRNAVVKNRVAHAYLFCGTRGTGKTSTARILAKALNCADLQNGEPCNHCAACTAITEGSFLDVVEIDAASNRGVDDARSLLEKVAFVPVLGKRKVYIIDECHMLTNEAFNALLKTLEEPPDHVVFILATTEVRKVPMTILSRCQRFDFRTIGEEALFRALRNIADAEGISADDDAIELLAERAKGSMRDALTLMDQLLGAGDTFTVEDINHLTGSVTYDFWPEFFRNLADHNLPAVFRAIDGLYAEGKDLRGFFRDFRNVAGDLISGASEHRQGRYAAMLKACASPFTPAQILEIITVCGESEIIFRYNQDGKAVCRFLMAKIMKALHPTVPDSVPVSAPKEETAQQPPAKPKAKPADDFIFPNEIITATPQKSPQKAKATAKQELPPWEDAPEPPPAQEPLPWDNAPEPPPAQEPLPWDNAPEPPPAQESLPWDNAPEPPPKLNLPTQSKPSAEEIPSWKAMPDFSAPQRQPEKPQTIPAEPSQPSPIQQDNTADEEDTEELWAAILKQVRELNPSTHTWLMRGNPETVSRQEVVVSYRENNLMHYNRITEPSHRKIVAEALEIVFKQPVSFRPELKSPVEEPSLF